VNTLFLCVANSTRSQMAEGLAKLLLDNEFHIESAGSVPAKHVHPLAVKVLRKIGINISHHKPKSIDLGSGGNRILPEYPRCDSNKNRKAQSRVSGLSPT